MVRDIALSADGRLIASCGMDGIVQETRILQPTQSATAYANTLHRFFNPTDQRTRFLVKIRPGHAGFEQSLQIAYGLAADGKTNAKSLPTNLYYLAVIFILGEGMVPGLFALLTPVFSYLAARARRKGIEQALIMYLPRRWAMSGVRA